MKIKDILEKYTRWRNEDGFRVIDDDDFNKLEKDLQEYMNTLKINTMVHFQYHEGQTPEESLKRQKELAIAYIEDYKEWRDLNYGVCKKCIGVTYGDAGFSPLKKCKCKKENQKQEESWIEGYKKWKESRKEENERRENENNI